MCEFFSRDVADSNDFEVMCGFCVYQIHILTTPLTDFDIHSRNLKIVTELFSGV